MMNRFSVLAEEGQEIDPLLLNEASDLSYDASGDKNEQINSIMEILSSFSTRTDLFPHFPNLIQSNLGERALFFTLQALQNTILSQWQMCPIDGVENIKNLLITQLKHACSVNHKTSVVMKIDIIIIIIGVLEYPERWPSLISDIIEGKISGDCPANDFILMQNLVHHLRFNQDRIVTKERALLLKKVFNEELDFVNGWILSVIIDPDVDFDLKKATFLLLRDFIAMTQIKFYIDFNMIQHIMNQPAELIPDALEAMSSILANPREIGSVQGCDIYILNTIICSIKELESVNVQILNAYAKVVVPFITIFERNFSSYREEIYETAVNFTLMATLVVTEEAFDNCVYFWTVAFRNYIGKREIAEIYKEPLQRIKREIIFKIPAPYEIIDKTNSLGDSSPTLEVMTSNDFPFRKTYDLLKIITQIDQADMFAVVHDSLSSIVNGQLDIDQISSLSWAFASIFSFFSQEDELTYMTEFLGLLLKLWETLPEFDDKVRIACNILFVISQNCPFMSRYWDIMKTFVNRIFEFMQCQNAELQLLSIETLYLLMVRCQQMFIQIQPGESTMLIEQIVTSFPDLMDSIGPYGIKKLFDKIVMSTKMVQNINIRSQLYDSLLGMIQEIVLDLITNPMQGSDDFNRKIIHYISLVTILAKKMPQNHVRFIDEYFYKIASLSMTYCNEYIQNAIQYKAKSVLMKYICCCIDFTPDPHNASRVLLSHDILLHLSNDFAQNLNSRVPWTIKLFATIALRLPQQFDLIFETVFNQVIEPSMQIALENYRYAFFVLLFFENIIKFSTHILVDYPEELRILIFEFIKTESLDSYYPVAEKAIEMITMIFIHADLRLTQMKSKVFFNTYAPDMFSHLLNMLIDIDNKGKTSVVIADIMYFMKRPDFALLQENLFSFLCFTNPYMSPQSVYDFLQSLLNINLDDLTRAMMDYIICAYQMTPTQIGEYEAEMEKILSKLSQNKNEHETKELSMSENTTDPGKIAANISSININ